MTAPGCGRRAEGEAMSLTPPPKLTGSRCRCGGCGELFASAYAFDRHRRGEYSHDPATRYCLTAEQLAADGWTRDARGFWRTAGNGRWPLASSQISGDRQDSAPTQRGGA